MGRKAKSNKPRASTADPAKEKNAPPPPPKIHRRGGPGRPRSEIDFDQFEALCGMHCTKLEICGWFEIDDHTLEDRVREHYGRVFSEIHEELKGSARASLRRRVWQAAMDGDQQTARFLYKNHCEAPAIKGPPGVPANPAGVAPDPALLADLLAQLSRLNNRPPEDERT